MRDSISLLSVSLSVIYQVLACQSLHNLHLCMIWIWETVLLVICLSFHIKKYYFIIELNLILTIPCNRWKFTTLLVVFFMLRSSSIFVTLQCWTKFNERIDSIWTSGNTILKIKIITANNVFPKLKLYIDLVKGTNYLCWVPLSGPSKC